MSTAKPKPTVMFVCVHNAGRSQMAAGYLQHFAGDRIAVLSSGTMPADQLHPVVIEAMAEEGIDLSDRQPAVLTVDDVKASDVVITMGCGDACPIFPGKRYLDWALDDPARGMEIFRSLADATSVTVTVDRNGEIEMLTLDTAALQRQLQDPDSENPTE